MRKRVVPFLFGMMLPALAIVPPAVTQEPPPGLRAQVQAPRRVQPDKPRPENSPPAQQEAPAPGLDAIGRDAIGLGQIPLGGGDKDSAPLPEVSPPNK